MSLPVQLTLDSIQEAYSAHTLTPTRLVHSLILRNSAASAKAVFISQPSTNALIARATELEAQLPSDRGSLWGVPFAVKDNIDVAGAPTTAACPAFEYTPPANAPVVDVLLSAGAIFVGKTNMDQFACGLVGTRSDYGIPPNAFDARFIPGGSSSGSAVAVAAGLAAFSLGTDTAGSGRVPAGLNGIVGIKPSVGRFSTQGVVPACRSLDCVSIFCNSVADGVAVAAVLDGSICDADPSWRPRDEAMLRRRHAGGRFRFGVPSPNLLGFGGGPGGAVVEHGMNHTGAICSAPCDAPMKYPYDVCTAMTEHMNLAIQRLQSLGGELVHDFNFQVFATTAALLYGAPFVAERYAGIATFLQQGDTNPAAPGNVVDILPDERLLPVIRAIISHTARYSAADVFTGMARLAELQAAARRELHKVDVLMVPTAAYNYTLQEIAEQETSLEGMLGTLPAFNANLGRFTNFCNLLNMCGVAVWSSVMKISHDGPRAKALQEAGGSATVALPFGITLLGPAWSDSYVADMAAAYEAATGLTAGPKGHGVC